MSPIERWKEAIRMWNNYRILVKVTEDGDPRKEFFVQKMNEWRKIVDEAPPGWLEKNV